MKNILLDLTFYADDTDFGDFDKGLYVLKISNDKEELSEEDIIEKLKESDYAAQLYLNGNKPLYCENGININSLIFMFNEKYNKPSIVNSGLEIVDVCVGDLNLNVSKFYRLSIIHNMVDVDLC